ncbi:MAG TPA: peptidoglycan-binding domain-containing protein [Stellaceae bacterium]|nr:peptidoglycan-binding domain-containing protein [Stellaceae bacterium]
MTPKMVQQVQASLQQQGLYRGSVDGLWGPATQASLKSYQQSHGLTATGEVDSPTLAALSLPSDGAIPTDQSSQQNAPAQETDSPPPDNHPPQGDQPQNNSAPPSDQSGSTPPDNNAPPQQQQQ